MTEQKEMNFAQYQQIDAVNHSNLKNMDISPRYYKCQLNSTYSSDAMNLGTAIHTALLEPDKANFVVFDGKVKRGKAWDNFKELNEGNIILSKGDSNKLESAQQSVMANNMIKNIFTDPDLETELTLEWTDEKTGLNCKARIDAYVDGYMYDLKTSSALTPDAFLRNAYKYYYHTQMAFYMRGLRACGYHCNDAKIVVVQTVLPFDSYMVNLPVDTLDFADKKIDEWLDKLQECQDEDNFYGFDQEAYNFDLPAWANVDEEPLKLTMGGKGVEL